MNEVLSLRRQSLAEVWQAHMQAEFVHKDAEKALATMTENPHVLCLGSGTGAVGRAKVREYYARQFLPYIPPDFEVRPLSQVLGAGYLVEEFVLHFTHSMPMDWMVPNVPVTGRRVELAAAAIIRFQGTKIAHEHIYWDQATVLSQLGVLDHPAARAGVTSAGQLLFLSEGLGVA